MVRMKREGVLNFLCDLNTISPLFTPFHTWCQRYSKDTKPILDNVKKIRNPSKRKTHTCFKIYWILFHHANTLRAQMARVKQQTEEGKKSHCKTIESSYCTASYCQRYIKSHSSWYIKNPLRTRDSKENYEIHIDHCTYMTICVLDVKNQFNC